MDLWYSTYEDDVGTDEEGTGEENHRKEAVGIEVVLCGEALPVLCAVGVQFLCEEDGDRCVVVWGERVRDRDGKAERLGFQLFGGPRALERP